MYIYEGNGPAASVASQMRRCNTRWVQANWLQEQQTKGTTTLAAMALRVHHELRSARYQGRRQ